MRITFMRSLRLTALAFALWGAALGEWFGVTTDTSGRVQQLDLRSNRLSGSIPGSLGNLSIFESLWLSPGNDELCAPNDEAFQAWLKSIGDLNWTGPTCTPGAPTGLTATAGDGEVTLSWTAPTNTGAAATTGYEYEVDGAGAWTATGPWGHSNGLKRVLVPVAGGDRGLQVRPLTGVGTPGGLQRRVVPAGWAPIRRLVGPWGGFERVLAPFLPDSPSAAAPADRPDSCVRVGSGRRSSGGSPRPTDCFLTGDWLWLVGVAGV